VSMTTRQLEAAALSVACPMHHVAAGIPCPGGGACLGRYGLAPGQWSGWFGEQSAADVGQPENRRVAEAVSHFSEVAPVVTK